MSDDLWQYRSLQPDMKQSWLLLQAIHIAIFALGFDHKNQSIGSGRLKLICICFIKKNLYVLISF